MRQYSPCIIYYYGLASGDGKTLKLYLEDRELDVTELVGLWSKPPQVVFLNLIEDKPISLGTVLSQLHQHVPLVVAQTWSSTDLAQPRQAAQAWFYTVLQSGGDQDPIAALHQHGLCTALAWGRYAHWQYSPQVTSIQEQLARLLLDREIQRGAVLQAASERPSCRPGYYSISGFLLNAFGRTET